SASAGRSDTRTTIQVMMVAMTSTEECSASEISASEPMMMPTTSFAAAMPALAKTEIAATRGFSLCTGILMGACLAAGRRASKNGIGRRYGDLFAIQTANYYEVSSLKSKRHDDLAEMLV